ncbi:MAG: hypothetical protein A2511_03235 [Deltaproteobacteria bacterium RIFOXYD12_FULL_50_9]|nr:MAG: hypothetical protein A2511_03235 [Deltaproteobacteria bacterium RIFOXYD12_FULL_50_9]
MTLFTKPDCILCEQLKNSFDLEAMQVNIEVLDSENAGPLAHLAWHGLIETARRTLPILVLDDCSKIDDFSLIEQNLMALASSLGIACQELLVKNSCQSGSCSFNNN